MAEVPQTPAEATTAANERRMSLTTMETHASLEFAPSRIPKLQAPPSQSPQSSPSRPDQALQAEMLELARALEHVTAQRSKLLSKSSSQPLPSLAPLVIHTKHTPNQTPVCDVFTDLLLCDCGEELRPADERIHRQLHCPRRLVRCIRPGCTQLFAAEQREAHEQRDCRFMRHTQQLVLARAAGDVPVTCELCHETRFVIRQRDLERHQHFLCVQRPVACRFAEWGCDRRFPQSEQERHEAQDCVVAQRRRQIAADALLVNETIVCDWCQQTVKKRKLLDHQEDECPERERPCPNAANGCPEWVPVGRFGVHLRSECIVTTERNALAARAREKDAKVACPECRMELRRRHLSRHWRHECVSRVVACKNAAHGCRARLRWRDRHLHEDFMTLSRDRSMLQFPTGGDAFIALDDTAADLPPPWTAEYFVWMVEAEEEILALLRSSLGFLETAVLATRENTQWQTKADACKRKLKELKQKRKRKAHAGPKATDAPISGEELSKAAQELAEAFNDAETGLAATRASLALARGWVELNVAEAKRIWDVDVPEESAKQALRVAVAAQTAQILQEKPLLVELLPEAERRVLDDLEAWAKLLASNAGAESKEERQRKAAEQSKLLKKRAELQAQLEALDADSADSQRLRRRFDRELAKLEAKLALVGDSKPTELLARCGRHVLASSRRSVIALVAGRRGEITFFRPLGASAAREVSFQTRVERRRWQHVVFAAGSKELSLFVNGELRSIRRGVFDLPMSRLGAKEAAGSFQGFIQEVRYWTECRSIQQIRRHGARILRVAQCPALAAYWTFEEGMGELVDDMALQRPRAACVGTQWQLYDSPGARKRFGLPPTPSLRERTSCVVNQQLKLLAQRARDRESDSVPCRQLCTAVVAVRQLERHHRLECVHRVVVCREPGCELTYRWSDRQKHLLERCERHQLRVELLRRYHEKRELVDCILLCGTQVQRRFLTLHCQRECVNRLITCPWSDCGETIVAHTLDSHLASDCRSHIRDREREMVANARRRQAMRAAAALARTGEELQSEDSDG